MEVRGFIKDVDIINKIFITFEINKNIDVSLIDELLNKDLDITFKPHKEKRGNDANSYMWVLCDKIAQKINSTKEEVYRDAIRNVGVFEIVPIRKDAVERFIDNWKHNGVGWVCESLGESKLEGYEKIVTYYGSSTYNTKEMARLVDYIVEEAKGQGIEVLPPNELQSMKEAWGV